MPRVERSEPFFDAILTPHRSLSPLGFWLLMAAVSAVSFTAGLAFYLQGAWPIMGFFGLDVLLVYLAFRANYRAARLYETVRLTDTELVVRRVDPKGRERLWRFEPYWLRVKIDDPPRHESPLVLTSHGRQLVIGSFLTPEERADFAHALTAALGRWRDSALAGRR
jgi:uncharacterized membrane protein